MFLIDEGTSKPLITNDDDKLLVAFRDKVLPITEGKLDLTKLADEIREFVDAYSSNGGVEPVSTVVTKVALTKASQAINEVIEETKKPKTVDESKLNIALTLLARSGLAAVIPTDWTKSIGQFVSQFGGLK